MPVGVRLGDADPFMYPAAPFQGSSASDNPRYDLALAWMREIDGRAASLDFWARGNYARRLIANRRRSITPLLVPVQSVGEIRWAYRRLALLGVPVEFLWEGHLSKPLKVMHLHPGGPGDLWDAGWGYVAALETTWRIRRRNWYPVVGFARLMPEEVASWIVQEAPDAFALGDVFITPSDLVGVPPSEDQCASAFETLTGAVPVRSDAAAETILRIELPVLDGLRPHEFFKLLTENTVELERLRFAFRKLVTSAGEAVLDTLVAELNHETSELTLADHYHKFRSKVTRLGGVVGTTAAAVGAAVGAASGSLAAAVVASVAGVAAAGLCECVRDRAEHGLELRRNPLFLLWRLGAQEGTRFRKAPPAKHPYQRNEAAPIAIGDDGYFHWLAPPTAGIKFLAVRKAR